MIYQPGFCFQFFNCRISLSGMGYQYILESKHSLFYHSTGIIKLLDGIFRLFRNLWFCFIPGKYTYPIYIHRNVSQIGIPVFGIADTIFILPPICPVIAMSPGSLFSSLRYCFGYKCIISVIIVNVLNVLVTLPSNR